MSITSPIFKIISLADSAVNNYVIKDLTDLKLVARLLLWIINIRKQQQSETGILVITEIFQYMFEPIKIITLCLQVGYPISRTQPPKDQVTDLYKYVPSDPIPKLQVAVY